MKFVPVQIGLCSLTVFASCSLPERNSDTIAPNVILVVVDDLGWKDLGCYGSSFYDTPAVDSFALRSCLFKTAYSSSPVCSPTRAAILTGRNPVRINITDYIPGFVHPNPKLETPEDLNALPLKEVTIAESLKEKGYDTWFIGKWHLGDKGFYPTDQGFDINFAGNHRGSPPGGYYTPYNNPELIDGPTGEYLTDRLTEEAINLIRNRGDNPFFLQLCYYTVHTPIQANIKHIDSYIEKRELLNIADPDSVFSEHEGRTRVYQSNSEYASMVRAMDENFGRLISTIENFGLLQNTIIIFTSDNGGLSTLSSDRMIPPTSDLPLRAGKGWCYEGGIRIPLLIWYPGMKTEGNQINEAVISTDLYPTILELAGFDTEPEYHIDGISLCPLLEGENSLERDHLLWHFPHYHGSSWTPGSAIQKGKWKMIKFYHWSKTELYNLEEDIMELHDLSEEYPEKVSELETILFREIEEMSGSLPIMKQ